MSRKLAAEIGRRIQPPQPPGALTLQRATVVTWDSAHGSYVVDLNGTDLSGVLMLASAAPVAAGDQVAVLVQQYSALIIGVIAAPS